MSLLAAAALSVVIGGQGSIVEQTTAGGLDDFSSAPSAIATAPSSPTEGVVQAQPEGNGESTLVQSAGNGITQSSNKVETTPSVNGSGETEMGASTSGSAAATSQSAASQNAGAVSRPSATTRPSGTTAATSGKPATSTTMSRPTTTTRPTTVAPAPEETPTGKIIVGYYGGWASYKGYSPEKIPASKLTHLHYAFAKIDSSGHIALSDPVNDRKNLAALRTLKKRYPKLKVMISVGGWDYSGSFSDVASTATKRQAFAQSCVNFIVEHGLDGVDIDWEYPVFGGKPGNSNRPADKQNFTLLLKVLREKLDERGRLDGRKYYLSAAVAANTSYLSRIEPKNVAAAVDYLFLMAYDMHGPWDSYADLNAPLYTPSESSPQYKGSVSDALKAYRNAGVPVGKTVLGMPFYGYVYQGVSAQNNGLYSTYSSAKSISYDALKSSYLNKAGYTTLRHATAQVPYLYGKNSFISYEDPQSIAAKVSLAKSSGLAGVGAWELSHDTSGALLDSAYRTLYK